MARPTKQGIDYFPIDTNFDGKTEMYLLETESVGLAVLVTLWQLIYSNEGYFIANDDDLPLLIKKRINVSINSINDCINTAIKRGLFDRQMNEKYKILTSKAIQKRYFDAAKRKKEVRYNADFILDGIDVSGNGVNVNNYPINAPHLSPNVKEDVEEDVNREREPFPPKKQSSDSPIPYQEILDTWNFFAENYDLPKVIKLTDQRKKKIRQRLKDKDFDLIEILRKAETQSFLFGENKRGWVVDFDFIFANEQNYVKILEGKYGANRKNDNGFTKAEWAELARSIENDPRYV